MFHFFVNLPATKADYVWCSILRVWLFPGFTCQNCFREHKHETQTFQNVFSRSHSAQAESSSPREHVIHVSVWCSWLPADRVQRQCLSRCLYQWPVVIWELQQGVRRGLATKAWWNMHWPEIELTDLARLCVLSVQGFDKNKSPRDHLIALGLRGCDCSICLAPFLVVAA